MTVAADPLVGINCSGNVGEERVEDVAIGALLCANPGATGEMINAIDSVPTKTPRSHDDGRSPATLRITTIATPNKPSKLSRKGEFHNRDSWLSQQEKLYQIMYIYFNKNT